MIAVDRLLTIQALRSLLFGITYAILEVNVPIYKYIPTLDYRIFYFVLFIFATISTNYYIWLGNFMLSMAFEDVSYWLIKNQLPFSYAWYYPVVDHIPIVDVIELIIVVVSYYFSHKKTTIYVRISNCDMLWWFLHGKTHDLYGLLIQIALSFVVLYYSFSLHNFPLLLYSVLVIVISSGVFVDLWSHCFHH